MGIVKVFAEVLPEHKDKAVTELQSRPHTVVLVGDGVDAAPDLAAPTSVAIGVSINSARARATGQRRSTYRQPLV